MQIICEKSLLHIVNYSRVTLFFFEELPYTLYIHDTVFIVKSLIQNLFWSVF